ncbi:MAG TPA: gliding motility-associated C-terminal domain-containing protein, partial [Bacteroidia bacterium]
MNLSTRLLILALFLLDAGLSFSQPLSASAGNATSVCKGSSATLGGSPTASGGTAPYTYSWVPSTFLSSTTVANPACTPTANTTYTVFVKDAANNTASSVVNVTIQSQSLADAGPDKSLCLGDTVQLGGPTNLTSGGTTYTWTPNVNISNVNAPYPMVWPTQTTTYTLTVNGPCSPGVTTVTVTVNSLPTVNAGPDVTIYSGQSTQLNGTGAVNYYWSPNVSLNYTNIPNPDADPTYTITYFLIGVDANGCAGYDDIKVTVLESDSLFIYNTFTPNADGDNDFWYIGNISKFPDNTLNVY